MIEQAPRIRAIMGVLHVVADIAAVARAYERWLGYMPVSREPVSEREAEDWGAPAMAGRASVTLAPASGEPCLLRFVESPAAAGYRALTSFGWTATEFTVADVDALAARLADSPFEIIGAPKGLTRFPMIRAMQAIGPGGECLYFTEIGAGSGLDLAPARAFVGRVFIVVAAGPDVDAMFVPYAGFTNTVDPPVATPVGVISAANGLPAETLHPHGLVKIGGGTMIELDGYPPAATSRTIAPGELPPGMAMVRFGVEGKSAPLGVHRGAAGELIEFAVTGDAAPGAARKETDDVARA